MPGPPFDHVCLGGTFSPLHRGHHRLVLTALAIGKHAFIGVTDGELARRDRAVPSVDERIEALQAYLGTMGVADRAEVAPITDKFGRGREKQFQAIVVTAETKPTADELNAAREHEGNDPLVIHEVPYVLGLDGLPVTGTRVAAGEIDPVGIEPKRVHIAVGSANPVKVEAAKRAFGRWVPTVEATPLAAESGVPSQPRDEQGPRGAVQRARYALGAVNDAGLGVGIEAALVSTDPSGELFDVQYAAIADPQGRVTVGAGPGFAYPPRVHRLLEDGYDVGEAMDQIAGRASIGREEGAIGYLTRGGTDRTELTEWAVVSALVPRLRPELYDPLPFE